MRGAGLPLLRIAAYLAAAFAVVPIGAVVWLALTGEAGAAFTPALIARYALTSALLGAMVAVGATAMGATAAWLVVMYRFPGPRRVLLGAGAAAGGARLRARLRLRRPARRGRAGAHGAARLVRARPVPVRDPEPRRSGLRADRRLLSLRLPDRAGGLHHPVGLRAGGGADHGGEAVRGLPPGRPAAGAAGAGRRRGAGGDGDPGRLWGGEVPGRADPDHGRGARLVGVRLAGRRGAAVDDPAVRRRRPALAGADEPAGRELWRLLGALAHPGPGAAEGAVEVAGDAATACC